MVSMTEPISIDTFHQVEIKIGEIRSAQKVADADKLLQLQVRFGDEDRQIISGISGYFPEPEVLVGRRVAFVTNLQPRVIRGLESQGMILAAVDDDDHFSLLEAPGLAGVPIMHGAKVK